MALHLGSWYFQRVWSSSRKRWAGRLIIEKSGSDVTFTSPVRSVARGDAGFLVVTTRSGSTYEVQTRSQSEPLSESFVLDTDSVYIYPPVRDPCVRRLLLVTLTTPAEEVS